ncbi:MAG TPA: Uma2 family endonuclease [Thermoanaerobaculia bacterium]|nr:Uma2 family endonuclease [Thermoanaerobaculia bacterium]
MRKNVGLAALFLVLGAALPAAAIMLCEDCSCFNYCSTSCVTDNGWSNCGAATGLCQGSSSCGGGGCLTVGDAERFRELMRGFHDAVTTSEERGEVAARLTWRLAQHVEESGLGAVFAAGTRFQLPGRVQAPALAFVRAGAAKDVPDLVVEFVTAPRHEAAVAGWLSAGVKAVLEVDPSARTVSVLRGQDVRVYGDADSLELPDIVPGWSLRVGELFN